MTAALLFDLDGTLIDTDLLHHAAYVTVMAERGRDLTLDEYRQHIMGKPNADIVARYFPDAPDAEALVHRKESLFLEKLGTSVPPLHGLAAVLDWAVAHDIGMAVVTNAPRTNAEAMLRAAGLTDRFPTLVIGDECERAKPDPLPYQTAMRRLGVTPSRSIAFEDSPSGLRAARASGAYVFGLTTGLSPETLIGAGAHRTIADYTDPALWDRLETLKSAG